MGRRERLYNFGAYSKSGYESYLSPISLQLQNATKTSTKYILFALMWVIGMTTNCWTVYRHVYQSVCKHIEERAERWKLRHVWIKTSTPHKNTGLVPHRRFHLWQIANYVKPIWQNHLPSTAHQSTSHVSICNVYLPYMCAPKMQNWIQQWCARYGIGICISQIRMDVRDKLHLSSGIFYTRSTAIVIADV